MAEPATAAAAAPQGSEATPAVGATSTTEPVTQHVEIDQGDNDIDSTLGDDT